MTPESQRNEGRIEMLVEMDNDEVVDLLMKRVRFWTQDETTLELFEKMYKNSVDWGIFEGGKLDVMDIVDNDYVNWCSVITPEDEDWDIVLNAYKNGDRDISCETSSYGFVEAVTDDESAALIRWK